MNLTKLQKKTKRRKCLCGCGKWANPGRRFIYQHQFSSTSPMKRSFEGYPSFNRTRAHKVVVEVSAALEIGQEELRNYVEKVLRAASKVEPLKGAVFTASNLVVVEY